MTTTIETPAEQPELRRPFLKRRGTLPALVGIVALVVGAGIAGAATSGTQTKLDAAKSKEATLSAQIGTLQSRLNGAQTANVQANSRADAAVATAEKQVAARDSRARQQLASRSAGLDARSHQLDAREAKVTGEERAYASNSIPGDGTFVVGAQVQPGVYQTSGAPGGDCYWARLASFDTSNIIDNNNTTGPTTVQIAPSDRAFETTGCATWHKVG